ncbi:hypothetical protein [Methylosinus sp. RM1]|nr:hypothetical protein [Methylosinus sp. RM1]
MAGLVPAIHATPRPLIGDCAALKATTFARGLGRRSSERIFSPSQLEVAG